jgi:hypothetical protein
MRENVRERRSSYFMGLRIYCGWVEPWQGMETQMRARAAMDSEATLTHLRHLLSSAVHTNGKNLVTGCCDAEDLRPRKAPT